MNDFQKTVSGRVSSLEQSPSSDEVCLQGSVSWTAEEESRVRWKLDLQIVPTVSTSPTYNFYARHADLSNYR